MKLSDLTLREGIITDLKSTAKEDALREIVRRSQDAGLLAGIDPEELVSAFLWREGLASTGIGDGIACPECFQRQFDHTSGIVVLAPRGVEFGAVDGRPVDVFVLWFAPPIVLRQPDKPGDGNIGWAWKAITPRLKGKQFLEGLRRCRTRDEVFSLIEEADRTAPDVSPG